MSSCPFTSAFHCSLGLKSEAPGNTCTSSPTFAAFASRAMICTISSRTSPLPPGNWCDARRVTLAANTGAAATQRATAAAMRNVCFMDPLLVMDAALIVTRSGGGANGRAGHRLGGEVSHCGQDTPLRMRHAGELESHLDAGKRT